MSHVADEARDRGLPNLDLDGRTVHWFGKGSMHWSQLHSTIQLKMLFHPTPAMIVIHLAGNDLVDLKQAQLIKRITKGLSRLRSVFPETLIVWSDILPRTQWRGMDINRCSLETMNNKRKRINRAGRQAVTSFPTGRYICHEIDPQIHGLLKPDGTHLTKIGNSIFLLTFQEALRLFFNQPEKIFYDANDPVH